MLLSSDHCANPSVAVRSGVGQSPTEQAPSEIMYAGLQASAPTHNPGHDVYTKWFGYGHSEFPLERQHIFQFLLQPVSIADVMSVHDIITRDGLDCDPHIADLLVTAYSRHGEILEAHAVFDDVTERSVTSWNAMVTGYSQKGYGRQALQFFQAMHHQGVKADGITFVGVLGACGALGDLARGKAIHNLILDSKCASNAFVQTALINMYGRCGDLARAQLVFDKMNSHDVVSWTAMINACCQHGFCEEAVELFQRMQEEDVKPNKATFVSILGSFKGRISGNIGRIIHAQILDSGLEADVVVATALINMYSTCTALQDAIFMFQRMWYPNVVTWTALLGAFVQHGYHVEALQLFTDMELKAVRPNEVTFLHVLEACGNLADINECQAIHATVVFFGLESNIAVGTSLILMLHKCGALDDARSLFDKMHFRNVVVWNSMISQYGQLAQDKEALQLFDQMLKEGVIPDHVTFISILTPCAKLVDLEQGRMVHMHIINGGFESDIAVKGALINMYRKCGVLEDACLLFSKVDAVETSIWNAMMGTFLDHGAYQDSMHLYREMQSKNIAIDDSTFAYALSACANLANIRDGEAIYASIISSEFNSVNAIGNALITMYGSCGIPECAGILFNKLTFRDIVSWNAILDVHTQQGQGMNAFWLFQLMQECNIPNSVTFTSILSACCHVGLVNEAQCLFLSMSTHYQIIPTIEHSKCMIDLLGRVGQLEHAEVLVFTSQLTLDSTAWIALLSSCRLHGDLDRAEHVAKQIAHLNPQDLTPHILVFNVYAQNRYQILKQHTLEYG